MRACVLAFLVLISLPLSAQQPWTFRKEKDGIRVSTRPSDRSKFNDVRVEMDVPGELFQIEKILLNVNRYDAWSNVSRNTKVVKQLSPRNLIYYSQIKAPWPASNRDFFAELVCTADPAAHSLKVVATGKKDYEPAGKEFVRIPFSNATWLATAKPGRIIHIDYTLESDPGGSVPAWVLNYFSVKAPIDTFENLKKEMALQPTHQ